MSRQLLNLPKPIQLKKHIHPGSKWRKAAQLLVGHIIQRHGPVSNRDIYHIATKEINQTSLPSISSLQISALPGGTRPTPRHIIPSMSFLKKHVLPSLEGLRSYEKVYVRREATPQERAAMSSKQRQARGSDQGVFIDTWSWQWRPFSDIRLNPPKKPVPKQPPSKLLDHLNPRRRRARPEKEKRARIFAKAAKAAKQLGRLRAKAAFGI